MWLKSEDVSGHSSQIPFPKIWADKVNVLITLSFDLGNCGLVFWPTVISADNGQRFPEDPG